MSTFMMICFLLNRPIREGLVQEEPLDQEVTEMGTPNDMHIDGQENGKPKEANTGQPHKVLVSHEYR